MSVYEFFHISLFGLLVSSHFEIIFYLIHNLIQSLISTLFIQILKIVNISNNYNSYLLQNI